jgi:2-methylcitrate dehydratase PrpD
LSEIDDIHLASTTTPGAVVVPATLTLLSALPGTRAAALSQAVVAGYEAMVRLGHALDGPTILYRGIWPTYVTAAFGVAAAAARVLELDERQSAHALGMALAMASPGVGHQGGAQISRWLLLGHAARNGAMAAFAAQAGFTADPQLLEKDFFSSVYAITPRAAALTADLGKSAAIDRVSFKPWCAARQTMAASQATRELVQSGITPAEIAAIAIAVPPPYLKMVNHGVVKGDRASHLTSAPYQVALAATAPQAAYALEPSEPSAAVAALMGKVSVQADESLRVHFPKAWPARVVLSTAAQRHEKLMLHVPGDPERPFQERDVLSKFSRVLAPLLGEAASGALAARSLEAATKTAGVAELVAEIERACAGA